MEKTFTATVAGAEEVIAAARQRQVFVMEAMWTRFQPAIVAARALIDEGAIGESGSYKLILVWIGPTTLPTGCSTWPRAAVLDLRPVLSRHARSGRGERLAGSYWYRCRGGPAARL